MIYNYYYFLLLMLGYMSHQHCIWLYCDLPALLVKQDLRCSSLHYFRLERAPEYNHQHSISQLDKASSHERIQRPWWDLSTKLWGISDSKSVTLNTRPRMPSLLLSKILSGASRDRLRLQQILYDTKLLYCAYKVDWLITKKIKENVQVLISITCAWSLSCWAIWSGLT